jgi:hypothetical protein
MGCLLYEVNLGRRTGAVEVQGSGEVVIEGFFFPCGLSHQIPGERRSGEKLHREQKNDIPPVFYCLFSVPMSLCHRTCYLLCRRQKEVVAPAANRTRGPSMATMDFTTKPLALVVVDVYQDR